MRRVELFIHAYKEWCKNDPSNKHKLYQVVPLHVPVVLRTDYKPGDSLLSIIVLEFLNLTRSLIHLLNFVTTYFGHHPDDFDLFSNEIPHVLSPIDLLLLLTPLTQKLL